MHASTARGHKIAVSWPRFPGGALRSLIRLIGFFLILLALAIAGRRFAEKPASIPPPGSGERDTLVDGVRWRTREIAGTGAETVVFIHGLVASSSSWEKVLQAGIGNRPAIAVDLPGSGFSDRPWPYDYSAGGQAAHLMRFLEVRDLPRVVLVGNSLGGATALLVAAAQPDRMRALVLVDAASPGSPIPLATRAVRLPVVGEIAMELYVRPLMTLGFRQRLFGDPSLVTDDLVERYWKPVTVPGTRRAILAAARSNERGYERVAEKIHAPTLVIWGEKDRLLPLSEGRRLAATIPGARLVVLPDAGHLPQEESPEAFGRALSEFLRSVDAERPGLMSDPI